MEGLSEMVRNVVLVVMLAVLVEMLLPGKELARYVQLVMGLFVLISLLNPLLSLWQGKEVFSLQHWAAMPAAVSTQTILEKGQRLNQAGQDSALEEYRRRVEGQVEALVQLVPGVVQAQARVELGREGESGEMGRLERVAVLVETAAPGEPALGAGEVPPPAGMAGETVDPLQVKREVLSTVSSFYGLEAGRVQVVLSATGQTGSMDGGK